MSFRCPTCNYQSSSFETMQRHAVFCAERKQWAKERRAKRRKEKTL